MIRSSAVTVGEVFQVIKRGVKNHKPPPDFSHIEFPEKTKLWQVSKVPSYPGGLEPPKMMKNLKFMRGPELVHNQLIHKQYGIIAEHGGRMKFEHFELLRRHLTKKLDENRMFAVWRVDEPWQPLTKRPVGVTLGGGKGKIHHYVTPVKAHRVIVEVGGKCEFWEVKYILKNLANKMPFKARAVSYEMLEKEKEEEERKQALNLNPYNLEYLIKNNMLGVRKHIRKIDYDYYGKYT